MDIAGGIYRELCETPRWDAVYGSGGRAAAAVLELSAQVRLHTYVSVAHRRDVDRLRERGVEVNPTQATTTVVFAYFHPLSRPHLQPAPDQLRKEPPIAVEAHTVLRFGMIEGEARVMAKRAVFDPQTAREAGSFRANGSRAESLSLVMNEAEVRALARQDDLQEAARAALLQEGAEVLVVKRGIRGAVVFAASGGVDEIPAYKSEEVFKIGTGDVFSAHFAYWWGEGARSPAEAADRASRAVAAYAETRALPPPPDRGREPHRLLRKTGQVLLLGQADTLGSRYVLEEAQFALRELGVEVTSPALESRGTASPHSFNAVLAIAEAMPTLDEAELAKLAAGRPVVIFRERPAARARSVGAWKEVSDFTTALYEAAWSALS
jgi:hypothetical protein